MKPNTWRTLACTAAAAAFAAMSPATQGAVYPIDFDPQFDGTVKVELPNDAGCRALSGIVNVDTQPVCTLNLFSADVFPYPAGSPHYVPGVFTASGDIAENVFIDAGNFSQFDTRTFPLQILLQEVGGCADKENLIFCGALLTFQIGGTENPDFPGLATLTPGTVFLNADENWAFTPTGDTLYADYRVPEPGTLGLLLGAFGVGWILKRRKVAA